MAVIASPFIIVFGILYRRSSGLPLGKSMFKAYSVLQDVPGASACDEEDGASAWVLNMTHLVRTHSSQHTADSVAGNENQANLQQLTPR